MCLCMWLAVRMKAFVYSTLRVRFGTPKAKFSQHQERVWLYSPPNQGSSGDIPAPNPLFLLDSTNFRVCHFPDRKQ